MKQPHKHAALIKAWADGAEIQYLNEYATVPKWEDVVGSPSWDTNTQYRIKPEKEYPKSSLTNDEIFQVYADNTNENAEQSWRAIADAAVKRYIQEQEQ